MPRDRSRWPLRFRLYVLALMLLASPFVPGGLSALLASPGEGALWLLFISAANMLRIPVLPRFNMEVTLGAPVVVAAAVLLSPAFALLLTGLALTGERELKLRAPLWPALFNRAQEALSAGGASVAAAWLGAQMGQSVPALVGQTLIAVMVFNAANIVLVTVGLWSRGQFEGSEAVKHTSAPFPRFAVDFGLVLFLGVLVVVAYDAVGPWSLFLLALPLWLGYSALSSARESEDRAEELALRVRELETLNSLGTELVQARAREQVETTTRQALQEALGTERVEFSLDGDIPEERDVVKVLGSEPAAVGVPFDLGARSSAVVHAVAGLAGMALQRLDLERELAENEKARARLSERILEEATQERSRIALYLHDDVLPCFAAGEIQADNVRTALAVGKPEQADDLAGSVHAAVHDGIARLRQVLDELRDQVLVPGELRDGLQGALDDLGLRSGVKGSLIAPDSLPTLPLAIEILVLEVVRGCLTNVARHAQAEHAEVRVDLHHEGLTVSVVDDGDGFDMANVGTDHHGLDLMRQRVELARGRMTIESQPGDGTRVHLEVPL